MKLYRLLTALLIGRLVFTFAAAYAANVEFFKDKDSPRPNILLIYIDDLGYADLTSYGSDLYRTPHIDNLAKEGIRFTDAYAAAPICSPSRAAILTGKYPARLHITNWIPGHKRDEEKLSAPKWNQSGLLNSQEKTIGTLLGEAGYSTAWIGKWHAGGATQDHGFSAGKENWDLNKQKSEDDPKAVFQLTDEALDFIAKAKEPFFVCLSHYTVHTPVRYNSKVKAKYDAALKPEHIQTDTGYAAMVEAMDDSVAKLLDGLKKLGRLDDTIVIFYSDNGGQLGRTNNLPMRDGKGTLYEGGIRVPLIVRLPGAQNAGTVSHEVVTSTDFLPTLLEIAKASDKTPENVDGVSFLQHLLSGSKVQRDNDAVYWHFPHYHNGQPGSGIRKGNFKLLEFFEDGRLELYDLATDAGEKINLVTQMPEKTQELLHDLQQWRKDVGAQMMTPNPNYKAQ